MADYHPKNDCVNSDLTSNLRQFRSEKAPSCRSRSFISTRSPHKSQFSAWIECFRGEDDELSRGKAQSQIDAEMIQEKLEQIQKDRDEKLKQFQSEVSDRVRIITRKKQQEQLERSFDEWNKESKVICQSASPKKIPVANKNTCSFRASMSADKIKNIMTGEANVDASHNLENFVRSVAEIDKKTQMIRKQTHLARAGLVSKKVNLDMTSLPGGLWGKNQQQARKYPTKQNDEEVLSETCQNDRLKGEILNDMWTGFDIEQEIIEKRKDKKASASLQNVAAQNEKEGRSKSERKIRFQLPNESHKKFANKGYDAQKIKLTGGCLGKQEKKIQKEDLGSKENNHNYWTYRKLFMDIEREKVRETLRRKKHKKQIGRLKQDKEIERQLIEKEIEVFNEYKGQVHHEDKIREEKQLENEIKDKEQRDQNLKKTRESNRYIDALKNLLRQKVAGDYSKLLSICSCGNSLLDTHPDTCANNCIFYKNPKEYARVLTSVLSALEA